MFESYEQERDLRKERSKRQSKKLFLHPKGQSIKERARYQIDIRVAAVNTWQHKKSKLLYCIFVLQLVLTCELVNFGKKAHQNTDFN